MRHIYLTLSAESIYLSHDLASYDDKNECYMLNCKIPLYLALELEEMNHRALEKDKIIKLKRILGLKLFGNIYTKYVTAKMRRMLDIHKMNIGNKPKWISIDKNLKKVSISKEDKGKIQEIFEGKVVMRSEILKKLDFKEKTSDELEILLDILEAENICTIKPGLSRDDFGFKCNRCGSVGNVSVFPCYNCGSSECLLCVECMSLGMVTACDEVYFFYPKDNTFKNDSKDMKLSYEYPLTYLQERVSEDLINWFSSGEKEALIWAVCGAGKTEVTFKMIFDAVCEGKLVMLAVPRRDVVRELADRIRRVFTNVDVSALYGGSGEKSDSLTQIVVCTTHQAMKFYNKFDLIIIDEMDAYPYRGSEMLYNAVRRAAKNDAKTVMMTATPRRDMRKRAQNGSLPCFRISARHHRHPLLVPNVHVIEGDINFNKIGQELMQLILELIADEYKLFVFVPKRDMANRAKLGFEKWFYKNNIEDVRVESCTSQDKKRKEKCLKFQRGDIDIFVVTTILERGITVDRANVIVLMADFELVFDENALIQMAGRAGRTRENPNGKVHFICKKETLSIKMAIDQIKEMNHHAYLGRYIDYE